MEESYDLKSFIGRNTRIGWKGAASGTGRLLDATSDYLVIYETKGSVIYYRRDHIDSMSMDSRDISDLGGELTGDIPEYVKKDSFDKIIEALQYCWVQINRGGEEQVEGVLGDIFPDYVLLIAHDEMIIIFKHSIRSIGMEVKRAEKEQEKKEQEKKEQEKKESKSKKNVWQHWRRGRYFKAGI
ncbi:hypothetical protein [Aneurinibacillus aneurinilyticus]|uniref:hypothetical protein n=1 Tax=Aneurinibacillus aneurinilyticus TaxID=1391 RepID=UPI0023F2A1D9|nr:hypothetical protein [Aneurinibacillus aneurinilyticus]